MVIKFLEKLDVFVTSSVVFPLMATLKKLLKPDSCDPV